MRKIAPFIILLMFFSLVIIILINTKEKELNIEYVNNLDTSLQDKLLICVLNKDDKYVLTEVIKHNEEDTYIYVLKLYDHYRNNLPLTYKTPLKGNFEVEKVKKVSNTLYIDLQLEYYEEGLTEFLNALIWSYHDFGIEKLIMKINKQEYVISKNASINPVIVDANIYDNNKQIIYFEVNGDIMPITYYHKDNYIEFLMKKVQSKYTDINYEIKIIEQLVIIDIEDNEELLSEAAIKLIIKSIEQLGNYQDIVLIINKMEVFNN